MASLTVIIFFAFILISAILLQSISPVSPSPSNVTVVTNITGVPDRVTSIVDCFQSIFVSEVLRAQCFIREKYQLLINNGFSGRPISSDGTVLQQITPIKIGQTDGYYQDFEGGWSIFWSLNTGPHEVHGPIREKLISFADRGAELGLPTTDELSLLEGYGRFSHFQHGTLYWTAETGAFERHRHSSDEADRDHDKCSVHVSGGFLAGFVRYASNAASLGFYTYDPVNENVEVGQSYPSWAAVNGIEPVILEGVVTHKGEEFPHVSHEDWPTNHDTHDMTFHVEPYSTEDNQFTNLLGDNPNDPTIEVEWENGLGQNDEGPFEAPNIRGDSGGYYSVGHKRYDTIWNWPTFGDHVHVEGFWVWDRGHMENVNGKIYHKTEIHPPRLVAVQRDLPTTIKTDPDQPGYYATQVDVFASGDGGAIWNNRGIPQYSSFVQKVPMSERDYSFIVKNTLPRPSENSVLKWFIIKRAGDTFGNNPVVERVNTNPAAVKVTIPWRSEAHPDNQIFGRTLYLYWDEGNGIPTDYNIRAFKVTVEKLNVVDNEDPTDGEYRVFVDIGGKWFFLNEAAATINPFTLQPVPFDDILNDGIGDTGDESWVRYDPQAPASRLLNKVPTFTVYLPPDKSFRIHTGGWEADGSNDIFGNLIDPLASCDFLKDWLPDNVFSEGTWASGCQDDLIGEVNKIIPLPLAVVLSGFGGSSTYSSTGQVRDDPGCGDKSMDPNGNYKIDVRIRPGP